MRLKYAGGKGPIEVCKDPVEAVRLLAQVMPIGGSAHMLATYTAMLRIRNELAPAASRFSVLGRNLRHGQRG